MIPGHGQPITPHPNFQLFLTERVMEGAIANTKVSSLYTKCHFVRLNDGFDSIARMEEVINVHFPKMKKLIQKIPIQVCQVLIGQNQNRKIGLREAIRFAHRLSGSTNEKSGTNEKQIATSIQDALDIFAEYIPPEAPEKKKVVDKICQVHSANHQIVKSLLNKVRFQISRPFLIGPCNMTISLVQF